MTEEQVTAIIRSFGVRMHYRGSSSRGHTTYAVFRNGVCVSECLPHGEAVKERDRLAAKAVVEELARDLVRDLMDDMLGQLVLSPPFALGVALAAAGFDAPDR